MEKGFVAGLEQYTTSQEIPRIASGHQKPGETRRFCFLEPSKKEREREREAVLILNPRLPALQLLGNKSIIASCPVLATLGK